MKKAVQNPLTKKLNASKPIQTRRDTVSIPKALNSQKSKITQGIMAGKKGMGLKADTTQKIKVGGGQKPSVIIKKQTTVKPTKPEVVNLPYKPNFVTKTDKGTGKQTRVIVGGPKVETLPSKIQYTTDKFGNKQVVKPSNELIKLKNKK